MKNRMHSVRSGLVAAIGLVLLTGACTTGGGNGQPEATTPPDSTTSTTGGLVVNTTVASLPVTTGGVTVTDDTIYFGLLAALTGPFSGSVIDVIDAQTAFWSKVNDEGGIAGRQVE